MTAFEGVFTGGSPLVAAPARPRLYPADVDYAAELPAETLVDLFGRAAARFGDRPFLEFLGRKMTFAEVARLVERTAAGLRSLGVGPGSRVGLCLPNCPAYVIAYHGALRAGATVVNYNPLYAERELIHQIEDSATEVMILIDVVPLCAKLERVAAATGLKRLVVARMAEQLPFPKSLLYPVARRRDVAVLPKDDRWLAFAALLRLGGGEAPAPANRPSDTAVLQYTGGTTGVPKGAVLTHANLAINARQVRLWFSQTEEGRERIVGVLPFFHVFGMTAVMNYAVVAGAEIILLPRFEALPLMTAIAGKKATLLAAVPTILTALLNHPDLGRHDLRSLKMSISGGAPLPVEVKHRFEALTGCVVVEGYGLTETSPVAACNPIGGVNKAGSVGLPLPGTRIGIVSTEDGTTLLPPGERGEVCIGGPQVMAGYLGRPAETADAMRGGLFHTGDVGYQDEDGYTFLVDRLKDVILCGGYNVHPRMVEEALYLHPDVVEAAVVGVPDAYKGQRVKAYVVARPGVVLTAEGLRAFLEDKLSPIETPREFAFPVELPKSAVGKILKRELLRLEASGPGPDARP